MTLRALPPASARRATELAKNGLPPQPIRELIDDIQGDVRVARLREAIAGQADPDLATAISYKKLILDGMYLDWVEGKGV